MDQARNLLNLHTDFNSDMFASMDQLLRYKYNRDIFEVLETRVMCRSKL